MSVETDLNSAVTNPIGGRMRRALAITIVAVLALGALSGCSDSGNDVQNDVLGVSVITSPLGRAHIAITGSTVGVQLPDMTTDTTLGLSRDGVVVSRQHLDPGEEVKLSADTEGLYELIAIEEGEAFSEGDAELGQSTAITRLTVVRIGE